MEHLVKSTYQSSTGFKFVEECNFSIYIKNAQKPILMTKENIENVLDAMEEKFNNLPDNEKSHTIVWDSLGEITKIAK